MMRREFSKRVKRDAAARSCGRCEQCGLKLVSGGYHYDHVLPDAMGGEPELHNCEVLCRACHNHKTRTRDVPMIAKSNRQRDRERGIKTSGRKLPGSKDSPVKIKLNRQVVNRYTGEVIR